METIDKYRTYILAGIVLVGLTALAVFDNKPTDANVAKADDQKVAVTETKQQSKSATTYSYVAQAGDSYSVLARKAVQTYGINEKVKLSLAQIIAAETMLTQNAGAPELNLAQTVTFDKTTVKTVVETARKLSADQIAVWQTYVASVDFNTNAAGQAR